MVGSALGLDGDTPATRVDVVDLQHGRDRSIVGLEQPRRYHAAVDQEPQCVGAADARVIVFDEPTSSLGRADAERATDAIRARFGKDAIRKGRALR